jgi:hypothetical protein
MKLLDELRNEGVLFLVVALALFRGPPMSGILIRLLSHGLIVALSLKKRGLGSQ